jgi:predicted Fe-S protein YdhL (DUF1289 family)
MAAVSRFGQPGVARDGGLCLAEGVTKDPPSPCTGVCRIVPESGQCEGCARTMAEIIDWPGMDSGAKRAVWQRIRDRRA